MSAPYRDAPTWQTPILVTTANEVHGFRVVHYFGLVRGIVVRSIDIAQGFIGGLKQLAGGNIREYTVVCEQARQEAYLLMMQHAETVGANAVIAMRYDATEFVGGTTEVLAYGTAVRVEPMSGG